MFVLFFGQGSSGSPGQKGDPGSPGVKVSYIGSNSLISWRILSVV